MLSAGPALADPKKLEQLCNDLKPHLVTAQQITLLGPNGTRISGQCQSMGLETGLYALPGEGGNFPSGEIYTFGLMADSIDGFVHSNIKIKGLGLSCPGNDAIFQVIAGKIQSLANLPAPNFVSHIKDFPELWYVGELAFGICPYGTVYPYADSIQEEKILGTAHVGLGSDISFGGQRKGRHLDIVFGPATVIIDDKTIISGGKINLAYLSPESMAWIQAQDPNLIFQG